MPVKYVPRSLICDSVIPSAAWCCVTLDCVIFVSGTFAQVTAADKSFVSVKLVNAPMPAAVGGVYLNSPDVLL
jgi:hypothetical protein